jgi:hypothetical protein
MAHFPALRRSAVLAACGLATVTMVLTLSRAWRWPNDFAEAHWLLDYRFGFVKRGLAGQLLSSTLKVARAEPTATIIAVISIVLLVALAVVLLWTVWQLVRSAARPGGAVLASLAFVSSPFIVMSAHLVGYLDGLVILLTVGAVALMLRGRAWTAGVVQAIAILFHESALLLGFPVLALAWWVSAGLHGEDQTRLRRAAPLVLPIVAFVALALSARRLPSDFQELYSLRLMTYPFVEGDMHVFVPEWLTPGFAQHLAEQQHRFGERLASPAMLGLMLPTILALLAWTVDACRVRVRSLTMGLLLGAIVAPQLMHAAAWDTMRIWTYSAAVAWLAAWTLARARGADGEVSSGVRGLALAAVLVNVMTTTYLLDNVSDRYSLTTRMVLFAPVLAAALALFLRTDPPAITAAPTDRPS